MEFGGILSMGGNKKNNKFRVPWMARRDSNIAAKRIPLMYRHALHNNGANAV